MAPTGTPYAVKSWLQETGACATGQDVGAAGADTTGGAFVIFALAVFAIT